MADDKKIGIGIVGTAAIANAHAAACNANPQIEIVGLAETRQGLERGNELELRDHLVVVTESEELFKGQRADLELLLDVGAHAPCDSCFLECCMTLVGGQRRGRLHRPPV